MKQIIGDWNQRGSVSFIADAEGLPVLESEKSLSMVPVIDPTSTQAPKLFFP